MKKKQQQITMGTWLLVLRDFVLSMIVKGQYSTIIKKEYQS